MMLSQENLLNPYALQDLKTINPFYDQNEKSNADKDNARIFYTQDNQKYCCSISNEIENNINDDNKDVLAKEIKFKFLKDS